MILSPSIGILWLNQRTVFVASNATPLVFMSLRSTGSPASVVLMPWWVLPPRMLPCTRQVINHWLEARYTPGDGTLGGARLITMLIIFLEHRTLSRTLPTKHLIGS